jgi:hypothetical protein
VRSYGRMYGGGLDYDDVSIYTLMILWLACQGNRKLDNMYKIWPPQYLCNLGIKWFLGSIHSTSAVCMKCFSLPSVIHVDNLRCTSARRMWTRF